MPSVSTNITRATLVLYRDGVIAHSWGLPGDWRGHDLRELPLASNVRDRILARAAQAPSFEIDAPEEAQPLRFTVLVLDALPMRPSIVSVREILLRTMDVFAAQARSASVELVVECASEVPPTLHGDCEKLAWLLATLVGNAVRLVRGAAEREPRVVLRAAYLASTDELTFTVTDNGPGMPEETARWLFDRDPRTGRPAGLALAMARDVVQAHAGTISVESQIGRGAVFCVTLPRGR